MKSNILIATISLSVLFLTSIFLIKTCFNNNKVIEKSSISSLELKTSTEPKLTNITPEQLEVVSILINLFERYQNEKNPKNILSIFTGPLTDLESKDLDFILGKDINMTRLYGTSGLDYALNWFIIKEVGVKNNITTIQVKEAVTVYDNSNADYSTNVVNKTFELVKTSKDNYMIQKYYLTDQPILSGHSDKYSGFF